MLLAALLSPLGSRNCVAVTLIVATPKRCIGPPQNICGVPSGFVAAPFWVRTPPTLGGAKTRISVISPLRLSSAFGPKRMLLTFVMVVRSVVRLMTISPVFSSAKKRFMGSVRYGLSNSIVDDDGL